MTVDGSRQNLDETLAIKEIRQPVAHIAYLASPKRVSPRRIGFLRKSAPLRKLLALSSPFVDHLDSLKTLHIVANALIKYVSTIPSY